MNTKSTIRNAILDGYRIMAKCNDEREEIKRRYDGFRPELIEEKLNEADFRRDWELAKNRAQLEKALAKFKNQRGFAANPDDIPDRVFALLSSDIPLDSDDLERLFDCGNFSTKKFVLARAEKDGTHISRHLYAPKDFSAAADAMLKFYDSTQQRPQWSEQWLSDLDRVYPEILDAELPSEM